MGLQDERLWGLCRREFDALLKQWETAHDREDRILATIRADLYNTSAKGFDRHFTPEDFLEGEVGAGDEERIRELIAQGMNPAAAACVVMSKQTKHQKIVVLDEMERRSQQKKQQQRRA